MSKMKVLAVVFALVALTSGFKIETKKAKLVTKATQCGPGQASCWSGCCPEEDWVCCPDQLLATCAVTLADCPVVAKKTRLIKMSKTKQCGPDETSCPGGCCPEANWFCCPDATYCAATADDCPYQARKAQLVKLAKTKSAQCGPDETTCPVGCCPFGPNWYCCPDHGPQFGAPTAADCL